MRLTCTRLTISKNCGVVPFKHRKNALFGGIFVDEFLRGPLVVYVIESKALPDAEVLVEIHIFLSFFFSDLSTEIFHDTAGFVFLANIQNGPELTAMNNFSFQRWSNSNDDSEILSSRLSL